MGKIVSLRETHAVHIRVWLKNVESPQTWIVPSLPTFSNANLSGIDTHGIFLRLFLGFKYSFLRVPGYHGFDSSLQVCTGFVEAEKSFGLHSMAIPYARS